MKPDIFKILEKYKNPISSKNDKPFEYVQDQEEPKSPEPRKSLSPEKQDSLKIANQQNSFSRFFKKNSELKFKKPLDDLWVEVDNDKNGFLDKDEAPQFLELVAEIINTDRKNNYNESSFDEMFERFDEDKNGYLSKAEMAQFLKQAFKKSMDSKKSQKDETPDSLVGYGTPQTDNLRKTDSEDPYKTPSKFDPSQI